LNLAAAVNGGKLCFIVVNQQVMYPALNTMGTLEFDRFFDSASNYTFYTDDDSQLRLKYNSPLDFTESFCFPCRNSAVSEAGLVNCGKSVGVRVCSTALL